MGPFQKHRQAEKACGCRGSGTPAAISPADAGKTSDVVLVLGSGCAKCSALEQAVGEVLAEQSTETTIDHVKDFSQIAACGVMSTSAPAADGRVVSYGQVLKKDEALIQQVRGPIMDKKLKVAFVCVHNSCRSQIAEALGKLLASDVFDSYSAGTETKPQINPDAVRLIKQLYGVDMEQTQRSKLLQELPPVDIVITMGCNVSCPSLPCRYREDWGLDDPTGQDDSCFLAVIRSIEQKVLELKEKLSSTVSY